MSYRIQPFETLPLKHYFMFGQVMQKPEICQLFLEELFGWDIEKIEYVDREKDITDSYWGHGIRLDIYIRNSDKVYNIEMQAEKEDALERRIRFYQSGIDREELRRGIHYSNLPDTFIIFICDYDPIGLGNAHYERQTYWKYSSHPCSDGTHAILLNSRYTTGNASPAILEFLDYVRTNDDTAEYSSSLAKQAKDQVQRVRLDKEVGGQYMLLEQKIQDTLAKGERIGIEKGERIGLEKGERIGLEKGERIGLDKGERIGLEKGERIGLEKGDMVRLITMVTKKLSKGKSIDVIADELEEDLSVIEAICKAAEAFGSDCDPLKLYEALKK